MPPNAGSLSKLHERRRRAPTVPVLATMPADPLAAGSLGKGDSV
jgi:hypothetical protein